MTFVYSLSYFNQLLPFAGGLAIVIPEVEYWHGTLDTCLEHTTTF